MPRYTVVDNELLIHHQDEIMKFITFTTPLVFLQCRSTKLSSNDLQKRFPPFCANCTTRGQNRYFQLRSVNKCFFSSVK